MGPHSTLVQVWTERGPELCVGETSLERGVWLSDGEVTTSYEEQLKGPTSIFSSPKGIWGKEADLLEGDQFPFNMRKGFLPMRQAIRWIEPSSEFSVIGHVLTETGQSILKNAMETFHKCHQCWAQGPLRSFR